MISLAQAVEQSPGANDLITLLANASPAVMLAIFIVALLKRWLVLPRELDDRDRRIDEVERERDEYKAMVFQALTIGERAADVAQERGIR